MINVREFGDIKGIKIFEITLKNDNGMALSALTYGAVIRSVIVPDRDGKPVDICLGYDTIEEYVKNDGYFGSTPGRCANRIGGAAFDLDGVHYELTKNEGPNHLHGGVHGWNEKIWNYELNEAENSVTFTTKSADGEQGYPGEVEAKAVYTLKADNAFTIDYYAVTDKPTVLNLTNHWYFNLNGHDAGDILDHVLTIHSNKTTEIREGLIPTGKILDIEKGSVLDFTTPKVIRKDFAEAAEMITGGYDHNYILGEPGVFREAAILSGDKSGITMTASTDQEGMQFYSGNFVTTRKGKGGCTYTKNYGMCFEPQHYPDAVNHPNFPTPILRPGETYRHHTEFRFTAE